MAKLFASFTLCLPFCFLVLQAVQNNLGADPAKEIVHSLGDYSLWLLMLIMLATPLQRVVRISLLIRYRRPLGVAMYSYALLHLFFYVTSYLGWQWSELLEDLAKRPYIIIGMLAFLLATPLAITSNNFFMKKLGKKWKELHRLVYILVILVLIHLVWQVKVDFTEIVLYTIFFLLMFLLRDKRIQKMISNWL